jgi:hypothetical protein
MKTMVSEPYVNHIPTMTGGVGYQHLRRFYKHHFIPKTPKDTTLIPISRTIGEGILVDELLFCFTHDMEIDWMLPGLAPTGKRVEIPLVAIVKFRGDKLYNEHIYRHRQVPRRQAIQRAYLLGSGLGAGADRRTRSEGPAGGRNRDRKQACRRKLAVKYADAELVRQRGQGLTA